MGFIKKLKDDFLFENYNKVKIQLLAFKNDDNLYIITHFKLEFSSKETNNSKFFLSIEDRSIYLRDVINITKFIKRFSFTNNKVLYKISDLAFIFSDLINIPRSYEDYLSMINSRYDEYMDLKSKHLMSLIYFNALYSNDGNFVKYRFNIRHQLESKESELSSFRVLYFEYHKDIFIVDGNLLNGREILEEEFGIGFSHSYIPLLIIEYPIESFQFNYKGKIIQNKFKINLRWDIKEQYEDIFKFSLYVRGIEQSIHSKSINILEEFLDFQAIDFIVRWKGVDRLIPHDTRIFWKYFYFLQNIPEIQFSIKKYREQVKEFRKITRLETKLDEIMKNYEALSKIYGKIAGEYQYLSSSSMIDYDQRIWLYRRLESKYYNKFLMIYKEKNPIQNQKFQFFLISNNLLYRNYLKNKGFIFKEEKRRLNKLVHYSYTGASPHFEINSMYYNIHSAIKIIQEEIKNAFSSHDYYSLLDSFEILGDLYIHQAVLLLISDDANFGFRKKKINLELALECYNKALKYKKKTEIPGVGRFSIYISNYMKLYDQFMESGYLERKIEYLEEILGRTPPKELSLQLKTSNLVEEIVDEISPVLERLNIRKSDIYQFLNQFDSEDLIEAMAILLRNTSFKTINDIVDDLTKLIYNHAGEFKNTFFVIFQDLYMKSNTLWLNLLSKLSSRKYNILPSGKVLACLRALDDESLCDIIFLDDVIGTGKQIVNNIKKYLSEQLEEIELLLKNKNNVRFLVLACFGSTESKNLISSEIPMIKRDNIHYANTIRQEDKAFSPKPGISENTMNKLKEYLRQKDPQYWRGKFNCEFLVILETNTPNNSIGCFWREESKIKPLSKRIVYS